jgi:hypothetical protein
MFVCFSYSDNKVSQSLDYNSLGSVGTLRNRPSFTSKGTKYYHLFNIRLCGEVRRHTHTLIDEQYFQPTITLWSWIELQFLRIGGLCVQIMWLTYPAPTLRKRPGNQPMWWRVSSVNQPSSPPVGGASAQHYPPSPPDQQTRSWVSTHNHTHFPCNLMPIFGTGIE